MSLSFASECPFLLFLVLVLNHPLRYAALVKTTSFEDQKLTLFLLLSSQLDANSFVIRGSQLKWVRGGIESSKRRVGKGKADVHDWRPNIGD